MSNIPAGGSSHYFPQHFHQTDYPQTLEAPSSLPYRIAATYEGAPFVVLAPGVALDSARQINTGQNEIREGQWVGRSTVDIGSVLEDGHQPLLSGEHVFSDEVLNDALRMQERNPGGILYLGIPPRAPRKYIPVIPIANVEMPQPEAAISSSRGSISIDMRVRPPSGDTRLLTSVLRSGTAAFLKRQNGKNRRSRPADRSERSDDRAGPSATSASGSGSEPRSEPLLTAFADANTDNSATGTPASTSGFMRMFTRRTPPSQLYRRLRGSRSPAATTSPAPAAASQPNTQNSSRGTSRSRPSSATTTSRFNAALRDVFTRPNERAPATADTSATRDGATSQSLRAWWRQLRNQPGNSPRAQEAFSERLARRLRNLAPRRNDRGESTGRVPDSSPGSSNTAARPQRAAQEQSGGFANVPGGGQRPAAPGSHRRARVRAFLRQRFGIDPVGSGVGLAEGNSPSFNRITEENSLSAARHMLAAFGRQQGDWLASQQEWVTSLREARRLRLELRNAEQSEPLEALQRIEAELTSHARNVLFLSAANDVLGFGNAEPPAPREFVNLPQFEHLVSGVVRVYAELSQQRPAAQQTNVRFATSPNDTERNRGLSDVQTDSGPSDPHPRS